MSTIKKPRFESVQLCQNFLLQDLSNPKKSHWYRKQTETTAIRASDNKISVIYPKEFIITIGNGVHSQPFTTIYNPNTKVVLLQSKTHHWKELSMIDAETVVEAQNLTLMTLAHPVHPKKKVAH